MLEKLTREEKIGLALVAVLLFPAGPFLALLALIAINLNRK